MLRQFTFIITLLEEDKFVKITNQILNTQRLPSCCDANV